MSAEKDVREDACSADKNDLVNPDQIMKDFALRTSMHGLQPIACSRTRSGQILWVGLLVVTVIYMLKSNIISVKRYMSYPFTTEVGEEFSGPSGLKFPSITVCPMNMFVKKKIELYDDNRLFHERGLNLEICKETRAARKRFNLTCGMFLMCTMNIYSVMKRDCGPANQMILFNYYKTKKNGSFKFDHEEQFRDLYGPNWKHSLYECKFGSSKCRASNFTKLITKFGKCFQFNAHSENVSYAFGTERLTLVLDAKIDQYTISPFFTEGFRFLIQDQGTYTNPDGGFVVSPGNIAKVNVQQKKKTYLATPYKSNCTKKSLHRYSTYTIQGCLSECFEDLNIRVCGCRRSGYLDSSTQGIRVCGGNDSSCQRRLVRSKFNPRDCDCRPPCSETTYTYQLSYSTFPDSSSTKIIKKHKRTSIDYQRKNLVAICIYYHATSYTKHDERASYTWEALLGEFGGNLGLMVGCSVLTAAEILELILQLIRGLLQRVFKRAERKIDHD